MKVFIAFISVVLLWSTTPLAVKWSGETVGPWFGFTARMLISAVVCFVVSGILRQPLLWHQSAIKAYFAAGIGIYLSMGGVYLGAQWIPSGLISVLFGLTPIFTGIFSQFWLKHERINPIQWLSILLGFTGLWIIFSHGLGHSPLTWQGIALVIWAVLSHSFSAVLVKKYSQDLRPWPLTTGGVFIATILCGFTWAYWDGSWPETIPHYTLMAILYLGLVGSTIGFVLYYFLLNRLGATRSALITLITPVLALIIGKYVNHEVFNSDLWVGSAGILLALAFFQWGDRLLAWYKFRNNDIVKR